MEVRQRPGRTGGRRDRKPRRQAEIAQPFGKVGDQSVFAAEQMCRAFDVEEETVAAVLVVPEIPAPWRRGRRIARRPQRDAAQRRIVGRGIERVHLKPFRLGAGVGEWFPDRKALRFRRRVQGGDMQAAARRDNKDEGPLRIHRLVCRSERLSGEKARDRPARQPD